jgi:C4-dicarboxylate-specific signal transduction histidine kinase
VLALLGPEIRQQQARVLIHLDTQLPTIQADRLLLEQADTGLQDGMLFIRVTDNGPGISAAAQAQVFEPFFTTKAEGLGLGLNICRTTVEAHRGRLIAENHPNGGAVFTVYLPASSARTRTT